ncbi:MAG TPA: hypothetical protein VJ718_10620, partial [Candidatus Binataceae bacterium]|nr:hypothetical protein [Candidatus Binataceae bacterium]
MARNAYLLAGTVALSLALAGCGGGGGGGSSFIPQPPIQPPPPPPPPVTIFGAPTVGEFTTIGASSKFSSLGDPGTGLGPISTADADQLHIRYTSAGT